MPGLDALTAGVGQTDQRDARHAIGGLLTLHGPTALDVRTGVLHAPGSTQLVTGTSRSGPKMSVLIGAHVAVGSRGAANGPYLGPTLDAPLEVDVELAPQSGSRIDVVYVKQRDTTSGIPTPDAATGPLYGVLAGQVSTGTPAKPDLSVIVGAEELGTVRVAAGATSTNGAGVTITNTVKQTVARGARLPVRSKAERDALTAYPSLEVYRLDVGQVQLCTAAPAGQPATWVTTYPAMQDWVVPGLSAGWQGDALGNQGYEAFAWRIEGPRVFLRGWLRAFTAQSVAGAPITTTALPLPIGANAIYPERDGTTKPTRVSILPFGGDAGRLLNGTPLAAETYLYFGGLSYPLF